MKNSLHECICKCFVFIFSELAILPRHFHYHVVARVS